MTCPQGAYLCGVQPDVVTIVCAVWRCVSTPQGGRIPEGVGHRRQSHRDRPEHLLDQRTLSLFQDYRV